AKQALGAWVKFYETVVPVRDRVVTADFVEVTTDFGEVIRSVNRRFGTDFGEFDHTQENVDRVFELIEKRNVERYGAVTETPAATCAYRLPSRTSRAGSVRSARAPRLCGPPGPRARSPRWFEPAASRSCTCTMCSRSSRRRCCERRVRRAQR